MMRDMICPPDVLSLPVYWTLCTEKCVPWSEDMEVVVPIVMISSSPVLLSYFDHLLLTLGLQNPVQSVFLPVNPHL